MTLMRVLIHCPYFVNSTLPTSGCKLFTINSTLEDFGVYDDLQKTVIYKNVYNTPLCQVRNRYPYMPISTIAESYQLCRWYNGG